MNELEKNLEETNKTVRNKYKELSKKLLDYINVTPHSSCSTIKQHKNNCYYVDEFDHAEQNEPVLMSQNEKVINSTNIVISVRSLIEELDNPTGLWILDEKILSYYKKNPDPFSNWDMIIFSEFNTKYNNYENDISNNISQTVSNLYKIRMINQNFYYKLISMYKKIKDKEYFMKLFNEFDTKYEDLNNKLENKDIKREAETITNELKNSIYTDFIAILGIFTAITFAIFGGINTINSISSNLKISSKTPQGLGNLLIGTSLLGIILYGIITVLFVGIDRTINKDYRLPILLNIAVISTLIIMFIVGCIFTFTTNDVWQLSPKTFLSPRIVFSIAFILIVYLFDFKFYKKYISNHYKKSSNKDGKDA